MADDATEVTDEVLARGRAVLERLDADDDFRREFASDPVATLRTAGIPDTVLPDLATAATADWGEDVVGFGRTVWNTFVCIDTDDPLGTKYAQSTTGCHVTTRCARSAWF